MGKSGNGRKLVQTDNASKHDNLIRENEKQMSEAAMDELDTRLQRLENANSGTTDVYKFAFFFFMGVVLTILIYPRVSSTFGTTAVHSRDNLQAKKSDSGFNIEQIDEIEELPSEESTPAGEKRTEQNKTKTAGDTPKYKQNIENEDLVKKKVNKREVKTESAERSKRDEEKGNDNEQTHKNNEKDITMEELEEEEGEPVILKREKNEDLMVDEFEESNAGDTSEDIINNEDNAEPRRVELFSGNVEDIASDLPIEIEKVSTNQQKPDQQKKKSQKTSKSSKPSQAKSKDKARKKNKKEESDPTTNQNVPKEIRDFKATYQKTLTPKKVFVDGRRIPPVELLPQKPNNSSVKIWLFEEFLSDEECDGLMRVHNKHVEEQSTDNPILCFDSVSTLRKHLKNVGKRVQVTSNDFTKGTTCVNASFSGQLKEWFKGNWSYSTAFYPGESRFATAFEQRVKQAMGLNPENGGKFQITSYPKDIGYKSHTDCTENSDDKRDRMATVLVYLDTVSEGGETEFPELGVWARPRKGRALLWNNMNPAGDCEPMSIHKANKVIDGHKFILQRWYYYKSFYSLGKRPPEPPLPERKPGQPRVSCDEYEHGSCRWYDEWNFEHMIEYERQKYTLV
ncbi:uncharacterized protein LOC123532764 [Mercenaria mercenaria]|uniref:uncharacterized protein LOC123532764 n=1 Tax=Mercenaria mercenaria TaxID=6596 RepID=UPI00234E5C60|nr:uncharacterized protein LOC123532764 [Mercenaria mercenaria]